MNRTTHVLRALAAALALALTASPALAQDKVKIGLMLPYTGTFAALGNAITNGFKLAIAEQGGKLGGRDIEYVTVDDESEPAKAPGSVEAVKPGSEPKVPSVTVVDRVEEAGAAVSIDDARVIVAGGRGVGGEAGFELVQQIADLLGGAVGATRAAVDSGWIPYAQQIGQTGKIVKPRLYLALGISGAIQHKVGMQTAETIIAINRDPDAPIAEFADMLVIGDLFEVGKALVQQLESRG